MSVKRFKSTASPSSMAMAKVRSQLKCPVCFNIPRDLPLPSCPSGHFVCRPCKTRVKDCPTCRQPMPANMTNSAIGALIEHVEHNCKFSDKGCDVQMMLQDLVTHEKQCPERTFNCPLFGCAEQVNLKSFEYHAIVDHTALMGPIGGKPFTCEILENNVVSDHNLSMACIQSLDEVFFANITYDKPSKCFVISVWLAKSQNIASKYKANLVIYGDNSKLCFDGIKVSSVEKILSIDKCIEGSGNISLCLPISLAKNLSVETRDAMRKSQLKSLNMEFSFKKI